MYNCYGQRTNRFLLMWYGFSFLDNRYDSYSFRVSFHREYVYVRVGWDSISFVFKLWMNMEPEKLNTALFEKIVF